MQEAAPTSPLQLLFIALRVGLVRSAIQAGFSSTAVAPSPFSSFSQRSSRHQGNGAILPLKWALALFGLGMFLAGITFVNAYIAQGVIAPGRSSAFGNVMRRLGLSLIVASLLLFLAGVGLAVSAI